MTGISPRPLTDLERLRTCGTAAYGTESTLFGTLDPAGEVHAVFYRTPRGHLHLTPLSPGRADAFTAHPGLGLSPSGVIADHDTATRSRTRGGGRVAGGRDHEQVVRWCRRFCADVGENGSMDAIDAGS